MAFAGVWPGIAAAIVGVPQVPPSDTITVGDRRYGFGVPNKSWHCGMAGWRSIGPIDGGAWLRRHRTGLNLRDGIPPFFPGFDRMRRHVATFISFPDSVRQGFVRALTVDMRRLPGGGVGQVLFRTGVVQPVSSISMMGQARGSRVGSSSAAIANDANAAGQFGSPQ